MRGEDERREDNTAGEEETTFTTSTQVSYKVDSYHICKTLSNGSRSQSVYISTKTLITPLRLTLISLLFKIKIFFE